MLQTQTAGYGVNLQESKNQFLTKVCSHIEVANTKRFGTGWLTPPIWVSDGGGGGSSLVLTVKLLLKLQITPKNHPPRAGSSPPDSFTSGMLSLD